VSTLVALSPILAGFTAGYILRRAGLAAMKDGSFLLLLNFYVCMPALVLRAIADVVIGWRLAVFPAAAAVMVGIGYGVGRVTVRLRRSAEPQAAVIVMGLMVVNCAFALPFVEAIYGRVGVARLAAFDLVNNLLVLTAVYAVAARASPTREAHGRVFGQLLRTPSPYAIAIGLVQNIGNLSMPTGVEKVVDGFAVTSPFLIAVGTGVLFAPIRGYLRRAAMFAATRLLVGASVTLVLVTGLGLTGVDRGVLLLLGVAPLGFVIVTFASLEDLDIELAAQTLALSMVGSLCMSVAIGIVLA
jgi:predicted permease